MCFFRSMILLRGWKDSIATNIYLIKHNVLTMCFLHYTASLPYTFFLDFLIPTFISFIIVTRNLNTACWFVNRPTQLHLRMVHPLSRCELSVKHDHCTDSFGRELTITMFIVIVMTLTQPCRIHHLFMHRDCSSSSTWQSTSTSSTSCRFLHTLSTTIGLEKSKKGVDRECAHAQYTGWRVLKLYIVVDILSWCNRNSSGFNLF